MSKLLVIEEVAEHLEKTVSSVRNCIYNKKLQHLIPQPLPRAGHERRRYWDSAAVFEWAIPQTSNSFHTKEIRNLGNLAISATAGKPTTWLSIEPEACEALARLCKHSPRKAVKLLHLLINEIADSTNSSSDMKEHTR